MASGAKVTGNSNKFLEPLVAHRNIEMSFEFLRGSDVASKEYVTRILGGKVFSPVNQRKFVRMDTLVCSYLEDDLDCSYCTIRRFS